MTAELSQMFRTKRDGVAFVLAAVAAAFPSARVRVFTVDGRFVNPDEARREPLAVAAANWAATACQVARTHPDAVLIDIGTTSTDIIPIVDGTVVARGLTDPDRLASGELVYTGALRTPVEAMASHVPFGAAMAGVSAEAFALAGDVHVWRGHLDAADYTCPTPDGRPSTREFAGERLARVVCADREMLDDAAVSAIADALARAQVERVSAAIARVVARHPSLRTAVVTGLGAFVAAAAAADAGLDVVRLADSLGDDAARCAPAASVARLYDETPVPRAAASPPASSESRRLAPAHYGGVDTIVKIGGGLLADSRVFESVLTVIAEVSRDRRLVVVPGGGPFADAVREVDGRLGLTDDAAHWMAILAMDQYAHLIASRLRGAVLVYQAIEIRPVLDAARVPVLAPSRWLRDADPLPHTWDVTSDSIAAWIAGEVGALSLVLIKPPHATSDTLVDPYFERALPSGVMSKVVPADRLDIVFQNSQRGTRAV
jgi:probable H4MPT-linked C1 transfer pathway protein